MDKTTLFNKLKQQYSSLGLGDEILSAHADALLATGFLTDENADTVVDGQKMFLEQLQRANDRRAADASRTAREKAMKDFQDEQAKKEAEQEEARKKAEAEAEAKKAEAERKAKEEAERKAKEDKAKAEAEEEARKKKELEEAQISDVVKKMLAERDEQAKAAREAAQKMQDELRERLEALAKEGEKNGAEWAKKFDDLRKVSEGQAETIKKMTKERDEQKAAEALREHRERITAKARELGIPQYRIDEGFTLSDDADEATVTNYLTKVANNIKAQQTPGPGERFTLNDGKEVSKDEMGQIAASMVR